MKKRTLLIISLILLTGCHKPVIEADPMEIGGNSETSHVSTSSNACNSSYSYGNKGTPKTLNENNYYFSRDDVALYLVTFHKLPSNYVKKDGDTSKAGSNTRIGGDYFSNGSDSSPTGLCLPAYSNFSECDVDASGTSGSKRGSHRLVYTTTFKIFYTYDHYSHWQEYLGYNNWGPTFASGYYIEICK
ncbi:MAG: hypothetical protein J1F32_05455 [Erysipelotrichales bacterium]|nr:hypothetical protein [Erysipelotrichales bacterium]